MFARLQEYLTRTGESTPKIFHSQDVCLCIHVKIHIHMFLLVDFMCVCVCVCVHIYIYTHTSYINVLYTHTHNVGFPGGMRGKEPTCQCRRHKKYRFYSWVRKITWRRYGNSLQSSCLENPMDRGVWQATVHGITKRVRHNWSDLAHMYTYT